MSKEASVVNRTVKNRLTSEPLLGNHVQTDTHGRARRSDVIFMEAKLNR
jgi:hypothetical protein